MTRTPEHEATREEICEAIGSLFSAVRTTKRTRGGGPPRDELLMVLVHGWMQTELGYMHPSGVDMSGWRDEAKRAGVDLSEWPAVNP